MSIKFKLLFLVIITLAITTFSVLIAVNLRFKRVIDENQHDLYEERANTVLGILKEYDDRLKMTGQEEAYKEAFQEAAIEVINKSYSQREHRGINLFIINNKNEEIMHTALAGKDLFEMREVIGDNSALWGMNETNDFELGNRWYYCKPFVNWEWVIIYIIPLEIKYMAVYQLAQILISIMVGITAVSIIVLWIAIIRITKPIGILIQGARAIAHGNYSLAIEIPGEGELQQLAADFNLMSKAINDKILVLNREIFEREEAQKEQEKLQAQLIHSQKMESVGRLAGGVAHDFNNMLGVIMGFTEMSLDKLDSSDPIHDYLNEVLKAAARSKDIVLQLLAFARKQVISPKPIDINNTVTAMIKMLQRIIGEDIDLIWIPGKERWAVNMDPVQIDQILVNLCINARDAIADSGKITIETKTAQFDEEYCSEHFGFLPGEFFLLIISDDGFGMEKETLKQIFDPFFTTKDVGKGTGLGLSTIYGIIKQNNGFVNVLSEPENGTSFYIYLPRYLGDVVSIPDNNTAKAHKKGNETILLVEDESAVLDITKEMLENLGYIVLTAKSPGEALRIVKDHTGDIELLITDVVMPEMNGQVLSQKILATSPRLKCLFMSGYTADVIGRHGVLEPGVHFIQKPFSKKELENKIQEILREE